MPSLTRLSCSHVPVSSEPSLAHASPPWSCGDLPPILVEVGCVALALLLAREEHEPQAIGPRTLGDGAFGCSPSPGVDKVWEINVSQKVRKVSNVLQAPQLLSASKSVCNTLKVETAISRQRGLPCKTPFTSATLERGPRGLQAHLLRPDTVEGQELEGLLRQYLRAEARALRRGSQGRRTPNRRRRNCAN